MGHGCGRIGRSARGAPWRAPDEDCAAEQIKQQHEQAAQQRRRHRCVPHLVADADVQQLVALWVKQEQQQSSLLLVPIGKTKHVHTCVQAYLMLLPRTLTRLFAVINDRM